MRIINYEETFGEIKFPEGFEELLTNLTIEEQMEYYRTTDYSYYSMTDWRNRTWSAGYRQLEGNPYVSALIVKDGLLVGVMMLNDCKREVPCLAEERVCTYYDCDNNGAGYKERIDYTYLVCVPKEFKAQQNV